MPNRSSKKHAVVTQRHSGARRLTTAFILLGCIAALTVATILLGAVYRRQMTTPGNSTVPTSGGAFGISSLTVSGAAHYTEAQILSAGGLVLGQSVWSVSTTQAQENILSLCPYVDAVSITSPTFGAYHIAVTETTVLGALYDSGEWVVVGANGNALERRTVQSDTPPRMIYLKGAAYSGAGLGKPAMDERSTHIVRTLAKAFAVNDLTAIAEIDLTDKASLSINWNRQITILLGNESNLEREIALAAEILPRVLKNHGNQAQGTLDVSSYSSDSAPDQIVFSPR